MLKYLIVGGFMSFLMNGCKTMENYNKDKRLQQYQDEISEKQAILNEKQLHYMDRLEIEEQQSAKIIQDLARKINSNYPK